MLFAVENEPAPWKVGNAAHFINIERRLREQVGFIRRLRDAGTIVNGPYAVLNRVAPAPLFMVDVPSWEHLSRLLHDDPMFIYQVPKISYLADWEEAMAKHADTIGSAAARESLEEDVLIDTGQFSELDRRRT